MNVFHRSDRSGFGPVALRVARVAALLLWLGLAGPAVAASASAASGVVNINTASASELQMLPGVGKVRADAIVALRKERGAFKSVDELKEVKGIGDAMLDRIRPHATLTGRTTARSTRGAAPASGGSR
ncbi:MAG: helix-hairpin-helix domain-containing protein [Deltaproteobacteria bacterium]|jgi:competence protein ComEA|nr:helix-hairpin-helix domain-containing protein [Deltaproteobacteria bacterium]MBW2385116.1 helix-hairpin-helix domain-containing protein [Deltaproteobacteria bacterium]MBW2695266.1 helix-hairpin-helix domain-containing protein [Deltaproteobacteria bacterium]